jgi:hypothetical protein
MDHPCYKCGQSTEDGKPFCLQCGAPQIRVTMPEPEALPAAGNVVSDVSADVSINDPLILAPPLSVAPISGGVEWPRAIRACAIAALVSILVMTLRLMVPPLAMLAAGCLAVILYQRRNPTRRVDARCGAQLGAVTALFCSGVLAIVSAIVLAVLQSSGEIRQQVIDALQQVASRSNDPQMQATLDLLKKPEGLAAKLILAMVGFLLISVAAGSLAGALTGAFISRRKRP